MQHDWFHWCLLWCRLKMHWNYWVPSPPSTTSTMIVWQLLARESAVQHTFSLTPSNWTCLGGLTAAEVWSSYRESSCLRSDSILGWLFVLAEILTAHKGLHEEQYGAARSLKQATVIQPRVWGSALPAVGAGSAPTCTPPWGDLTDQSQHIPHTAWG